MSKKLDRTNKLIEILKEKNGASVKELANILKVSEMTIRRDLEFLKSNNIVTKVYGATIYNPSNSIDKLSSNYDINDELIKFEHEKNKIGKAAAKLIKNNDVIIIDTGTTTEKLAMNIDNIVEASLAMLSMLIMEGFESEYNYYLDGWKSMKIKQAGDIIELQNDLAAIAPYPQEKRFAFSHEIGKTAPICFTACMATSQGEFSSLMEEFNGSFVVTRLSGLDKQTENMWLVDETFEFRKMT